MAFATRGAAVHGIQAGVDHSANQHKIMKLDASSKAVLCGAGERMIAVLGNDPILDQGAEMQSLGATVKVQVGVNLILGAPVGCAAGGLARPALSGDWILGDCTVQADVGELGSVFVTLQGQLP